MPCGVQGRHPGRLARDRVQNSYKALRRRGGPPPQQAGRQSPEDRGPLLAAIAFPRSRTLKDLLTLTDLTPA